MFKRANKMTALLVAAAAVVSLVPATGVNAADVKRIGSEDGTVYNAVAYKEGKAYIDGEIQDKDEAAYYLSEGKYSELEELDSNSKVDIYGEKYVDIESGDYFVDLTNGKVSDDDVKEDTIDDAASALRKKLKDDTEDRYLESDAGNTRDSKTLFTINGNKFGETWYETTVDSATTATKDAGNARVSDFNIVTDAKGNYIDADYNLGKIKVKPTTGSSVNVENTNDKVDFGKDNNDREFKDNLTAKVRDTKVLGQDSKNIYRMATITLTSVDGNIDEVYGVKVTDKTEFTKNGNDVSFKVIQKISKEAASDDVDGAKYAKSVTNYVISKDNGEKLTGSDLLASATDATKESYTVVDGKLVAYQTIVDGNDKKVLTQTISLKSKSGLYYTDTADQAKEGVEYSKNNETGYAVDVDAEGNIWRLDGGDVYKWDNDEDWDKVYKVDGSMDEISVYNKDNMVVWSEDDEVYSVINGKDAAKDETEKPVVAAKGWVQATDGTWTYVKEDGTKATGWLNLNGAWYFLNDAGVMATGWVNAGGSWYYTNTSGAMQTGWVIANGTWYYTNASGAMQTGWVNDNGTWYFCNASGAMQANTTIDGCVLGANGAWIR